MDGPVPVQVDSLVERELSDRGVAQDWRGQARPLVFSFDWDQPGAKVREGHVHPGLEVGLVLRGRIDMTFERAEVACGAGQAWLCGMWEPHAWEIREPGTRSIALVFLPELLAEQPVDAPPYFDLFALPAERRPLVQDPEMRQELAEIGRAIARELRGQKAHWQSMVRLDLLRLLGEHLRAGGAEAPGGIETGAPRDRCKLPQIMPAIKLIRDTPWARITAAEAATRCGVSESTFRDTFKRAMGISFGRFRLSARLAYAAHRLLYTDHTVEAVAGEAGFTDSSHLHRAFREHFGCSPAAYRSQQVR